MGDNPPIWRCSHLLSWVVIRPLEVFTFTPIGVQYMPRGVYHKHYYYTSWLNPETWLVDVSCSIRDSQWIFSTMHYYFLSDRSLLNPIVHGRSSHPMIIDERKWSLLLAKLWRVMLITCPANSTLDVIEVPRGFTVQMCD